QANAGTDTVTTAMSTYTLGANLENLTHTGSTDFIGIGNGLNNVLTGSTGNDTLTGGAGDDTVVGGAGSDTAIYTGAKANYAIVYNATSQTVSVTDLRAGSPDGTDLLKGVENLKFSDGTFTST